MLPQNQTHLHLKNLSCNRILVLLALIWELLRLWFDCKSVWMSFLAPRELYSDSWSIEAALYASMKIRAEVLYISKINKSNVYMLRNACVKMPQDSFLCSHFSLCFCLWLEIFNWSTISSFCLVMRIIGPLKGWIGYSVWLYFKWSYTWRWSMERQPLVTFLMDIGHYPLSSENIQMSHEITHIRKGTSSLFPQVIGYYTFKMTGIQSLLACIIFDQMAQTTPFWLTDWKLEALRV